MKSLLDAFYALSALAKSTICLFSTRPQSSNPTLTAKYLKLSNLEAHVGAGLHVRTAAKSLKVRA